jgi:hypothetical protein
MKKYIFNVKFTGDMDIEVEAESLDEAIHLVGMGYYYEVEVPANIHKELSNPDSWTLTIVKSESDNRFYFGKTVKDMTVDDSFDLADKLINKRLEEEK